METFWRAYMNFWNWRTGIPIAVIAATAVAFTVYASAEKSKLARAIRWGLIALVLAYGFVWLLIASRANVASQWWLDEEWQKNVASVIALAIGIPVGIIMAIAWRDDEPIAGFGCGILTFIVLAFIFTALFAAGNSVFIGGHYLLYGAALIGLPTIVAIRFILLKFQRPLVPLTLFGYLTATATVGLGYLLFSFDERQSAVGTFNLTWVLVTSVVVGGGLSLYYLWVLPQNKTATVEKLHPSYAIGAVVLNICLASPILFSDDRWLWILRFAGVSAFIGFIVLFGRWWVLSR
jgi:hypothetical protein